MAENFTLQLLHVTDPEAGISALDDIPLFSSVLQGLRSEYPDNTIFISAGDNHIPGPFYAASADPSLREILGAEGVGRGDILILNALGIDASALGNHEFDDGPNVLASIIGADGDYPGTLFPYVTANLDLEGTDLEQFFVEPGQEASTLPNSIAESVVITIGDEQIGIVGATTPLLPDISSPGNVGVRPDDPDDLEALAAEIQPFIDDLTAEGVNKIIFTGHLQQLQVDLALAEILTDVDIFIAGGSEAILANEGDRLRPGDEAVGVYPLIRESPTGDPVLIVSTGGDYEYLGRLVVEFDPDGVIIPESIDPGISGPYVIDEQAAEESGFDPLPDVVAITDAIRGVILEKDGVLFGESEVFLNGIRESVRTQETNLGNLTADANIFAARQVDDSEVIISLKNGGGIRDSIGTILETGERVPPLANELTGKEAGEVSQLDLENSLRFNNGLTLLSLTAEQLYEVIEHGVAASGPGATPGRFPQVGGMSFSFDVEQEPGSRVQSLAVLNEDGSVFDVVVQDGELVGDPERTFRMVTLDFLANGGDQYPFPEFEAANPELFNRVELLGDDIDDPGFDTFGTEQRAFADYLQELGVFGQPDTPPEADERVQNLSFREDTVLDGIMMPPIDPDPIDPVEQELVFGSPEGDEIFAGTNQIIFGGEGNDILDATAGGGGNRLYGGPGDDILFAGWGDRLFGEAGDDILFAGRGDNILSGGSGANQFWIAAGSLPEAPNIIVDFDLEVDVLGLGGTGLSFENLSVTQGNGNAAISAMDQDIAILLGIEAAALGADHFVFA
jgi:2',3'-cyclic-nucleotide 2'-phosphodiesterase (5'-nucleotidase family)